jgi:hypothetical protein
MSKVSANHKALYRSIKLQKQAYDELVNEYDQKEDEWKTNTENFDVITNLFDIKEKLKGTKYALVLIVAAYIEAMINHHFSLKASSNRALEANFMEKWTNELQKLHPGYSLLSSDDVYQTLDALKKERNAITHMKPEVENSGSVVKPGFNPSKVDDENVDRLWIEKFVTLPKDLVDHMEKTIPEHELRGIKVFSGLINFQ